MLYLDRSVYDQFLPPHIIQEWNTWLENNFDPGHYDSDKDRAYSPPQWYTETYCPEHLEEEVRRLTIGWPVKLDIGMFRRGQGYEVLRGL